MIELKEIIKSFEVYNYYVPCSLNNVFLQETRALKILCLPELHPMWCKKNLTATLGIGGSLILHQVIVTCLEL